MSDHTARRARRAVWSACLVLLVSGCGTEVAPTGSLSSALGLGAELWPTHVAIPDDPALLAQLRAAMDLKFPHDLDQALDAIDPGELREHATLTQPSLDTGLFDLGDLFTVGDELFGYEFRPENGLGNALAGAPSVLAGFLAAPNLRRIHEGEFGGPDSPSCQSCHAKGGPDGAGTNTQNAFLGGDGVHTSSADERSSPHLLGLGPVQALATEMSLELQGIRDQAIADATTGSVDVTRPLLAKGVEFGSITAKANGDIDTAAVVGVDPDLVVKPFGWKGHQATLRAMIEESFRIHMGIVSMRIQEQVRDGVLDTSLHGSAPYPDIDGDGTNTELEDGMLSTMVAYLAQLEAPVIVPPTDPTLVARFGRGRRVFSELGCGDCHRDSLQLSNPVIETGPEQKSHLEDMVVREPLRIDVASDGDEPKIVPIDLPRTAYDVALFSDLKRHDMGPELAAPRTHAGIPPSTYLTRPLWGLAFTAPYLHDGRAPTIREAIELHGGEAQASRDRFQSASEDDRRALLVFLSSLARAPKLFLP